MMKNYILLIIVTLISKNTLAQVTSQLTITPANPTPTDTILVISKLTYSGDCSYGLVYTYTSVTGNTLALNPTYCGYGATTTCVSTDTLKIAPLAIGNYIIEIQYHQGSVCPISGFDAVIGQTVAAVSVNTVNTTNVRMFSHNTNYLKIYPNPAKENVTVELTDTSRMALHVLLVRNLLGQLIMRQAIERQSTHLNLIDLPPGIYIIELENQSGIVSPQRIIVE